VVNRVLVLLSGAALSGCGLIPPAVSIASFVADAFSYVVSGKSVSDHGLSMVMQEDCAVLNFVQGEAICAPGPHPEIQMAAPRDRDDHTLLASAPIETDAPQEDREGLRWAPPAAGAFPVQYVAAGPVLGDPPIVPAVLTLEPLASGPIDSVASVGGEPAA
jgi:hypothetical protein